MIKHDKKLRQLLVDENEKYKKNTIECSDTLKLINELSNTNDKNQVVNVFRKTANVKNFRVKNYREYVIAVKDLFREVAKYCDFNFSVEHVIDYNEPIDIFISHSSKDDYIIHEFRKLLMAHGVDEDCIFMEHASNRLELTPGEAYLSEIKQHIKECEVFICLINEDFNASQMCNIEYGMALAYDLLILPFYSSDTAKYNDRIYNNTAHIETIISQRYLEKVLQMLDITPQDKSVQEFIMKFDSKIN